MRAFSNWLDAYMQYTDETEAPAIFRKWCAISTIAACLRRKVWLSMECKIYPNLYIVLCGPSGSRKGTAMAPCRSFLQTLGINLTAESLTREGLIVALSKSTFAELLPDGSMISHSSLTVFSTELAVFIRPNDDGLISALTQWFDCEDPWRYDTKNAGNYSIDGVWVNLIGATTPELLRVVFPESTITGGLTSRIIFVYAGKKGKIVPWVEITPESREIENKLLRDLEEIREITGEFKPTPAYKNAYTKWYVEQETNPPFMDYHFDAYLTRRALHLRKVSMIVSAARSSDLVLDVEDFDTARSILEEAEAAMTNVYRAYGRSDLAELFSRVMGLILTRDRVTYNEVLKRFYKDATTDELDTILETLKEMGEIRLMYDKGKDGRQKIREIRPAIPLGDSNMGVIQ